MDKKLKIAPAEVFIGDNTYLTVKSTTTVTINDYLRVMVDKNDSITLDIEIKADFNKIPHEYHELFMQMISVRYGGVVNIWDKNHPFSKPIAKKRWWQFWK